MKLLFDLFPIALFFVAYHLGSSHPDAAYAILTDAGIHLAANNKPGVFLATLVTIVATFVQIGWTWFHHRKVDGTLWLSFALVTVFGGATLLFHNETFIKWKPTVLYWIFTLVLLLGPALFDRNFIRLMMEKQIDLPDLIWSRLNFSWAMFFALLGALNIAIAFNYSTDTWVDFKMFGTTGLMLAFVLLQGLYLSKHVKEQS